VTTPSTRSDPRAECPSASTRGGRTFLTSDEHPYEKMISQSATADPSKDTREQIMYIGGGLLVVILIVVIVVFLMRR
jgi:hypothetical protein